MSEELKQSTTSTHTSGEQLPTVSGNLNSFPSLSNMLGEVMANATNEQKTELARDIIKMQHESIERDKDREHEARENAKNREYMALEQEKARAHETEENEMKRQHEDTEKQAERKHVTDEKAKDREYAASEGKKTRTHNYLLKYAPALLLLVALGVFAVLHFSSNVVDEVVNIEVPNSSKNYEGMHYLDVKTSLEDAGFKDIQEDRKADLTSGFLDGLTSKVLGSKDGIVERVSINGVSSFNKGDAFPKNATVRITYHTYPDSADNEE